MYCCISVFLFSNSYGAKVFRPKSVAFKPLLFFSWVVSVLNPLKFPTDVNVLELSCKTPFPLYHLLNVTDSDNSVALAFVHAIFEISLTLKPSGIEVIAPLAASIINCLNTSLCKPSLTSPM